MGGGLNYERRACKRHADTNYFNGLALKDGEFPACKGSFLIVQTTKLNEFNVPNVS